MTDDQHRAIARILGFPSCCVEAWLRDIRDPHAEPAAMARGGCHERIRTYHEVEALHAAITALLGEPWGAFAKSAGRRFEPEAGDMEKCWVPCDQCALVRDDWHPYDVFPFTVAQLEAAARPPRSVTNSTLPTLDTAA